MMPMKWLNEWLRIKAIPEGFTLEHKGEIIEFLDQRAFQRAFNSKFSLFLVLFPIFVGFANYTRSADPIVPAYWMFFSLTVWICIRFMRRHKAKIKRARYFLDIVSGTALILTAILTGYVEANGLITRGGPIQFAFIIQVANPFWYERKKIVQRSLMFAVMTYIFASIQFEAFWGILVVQVLIGSTVALLITLFFNAAEVQVVYSEMLAEKQRLRDEAEINQLSSDIQHAWTETARLVHPHQLTLLKMKHVLEETMSLDKRDAMVLEFDIKGSTQLSKKHGYDDFKVQLFKAIASTIIYKNYAFSDQWQNMKQPVSDGYFFKDMGDGFIVTVGHPFISKHRNLADQAVEMAIEMLNFAKRFLADHLNQEVHLCVCIEKNPVQGLWKAANVTGYDFTDASVSPVQRLGNLRRSLEEHKAIEREASQIIMSHRAFDPLDQKKKHFRGIELRNVGPDGIKLRDSVDDKFVYVMSIK